MHTCLYTIPFQTSTCYFCAMYLYTEIKWLSKPWIQTLHKWSRNDKVERCDVFKGSCICILHCRFWPSSFFEQKIVTLKENHWSVVAPPPPTLMLVNAPSRSSIPVFAPINIFNVTENNKLLVHLSLTMSMIVNIYNIEFIKWPAFRTGQVVVIKLSLVQL